jgi:hypothetical protein
VPARERSQDWQQLLQDYALGREAHEDELDYAVVERVYGIGPPGPRARRRVLACGRGGESQD